MTSGPLTTDDFLALFRDVNDEGYWRPIVEGDRPGIELHEQAIAQFVRASEAVDCTTQAAFIFPWSGQTNEPASGPTQATVELTFARATGNRHLVLDSGLTVVHTTTDYGPDGAIEITTGRRYFLTDRLVLLPGNVGPTATIGKAEYSGRGYNLPQPGTIQKILQLGSAFQNTGIVIENNVLRVGVGTGAMLSPTHVLSYIRITSGANAGQLRRVVEYISGTPTAIRLDDEWLFGGHLVSGLWISGETVRQGSTGARGRIVAGNSDSLVVEHVVGTFSATDPIAGDSSGTVFTPTTIEIQGNLSLGSADWVLLDWASDLGVSVTNLNFPTGGRLAMLDELGEERKLPRAPGESDSVYRNRIGTPADQVTPNAIRRVVNRQLSDLKLGCCFRQVGGSLLPGLFFDAGSSKNYPQNPRINFAYDMPNSGTSRFKRLLDLVHFRAYFMIGIPPTHLGEFGCAYGARNRNAYGAHVATGNAYDGYPIGTTKLKLAIQASVENARMAGVNWDLYTERVGCF